MTAKGFRLKAKLTAQIVLMSAVWPVVTIGAFVVAYKAVMWSFGGRENFREKVILQPMHDNWVQANPRTVMYREAPLSAVPEEITAMPKGDPSGALHHKNF